MLVSELVEAAHFLQEFADKRGLAPIIQSLIGATTQAAQGQAGELADAVDAAVATFEAVHAEIDAAGQRQATRELIRQFGGARVLGAPAIQRVRAIFEQHGTSHTAVLALQSMLSETTALVKRAKLLTSALEPVLARLEEPALAPNEGRLWLFFEHDTAVESMERLRDAADEWTEILHHFARVAPSARAPTRIISIQKSSPLVLEVAAHVAVLAPILWGVDRIVATLGRIIELRKKHEELTQLKVRTSILQDIAAQVRAERELIAASAADNVRERFQCDNEARNAIQAAFEKIARFIERGGQIDIDVQADAELSTGDNAVDGAPSDVRALIANVRKELLALPPFDERSGQNEPT